MDKIDKTYMKDLKKRLHTEMEEIKTEMSTLEGDALDSKEALYYCLKRASNAAQTIINCFELTHLQKELDLQNDETEEFELDA